MLESLRGMNAHTGDAPLMSWQQPCTSPITHARIHATSTFGWTQRYAAMYAILAIFMFTIMTNVKLKVIYSMKLIFISKINTTP